MSPPPRNKDAAALALLVGDEECRLAGRVLRNSADAEDVLQGTRLKVLESAVPREGWRHGPKSWVGRIAHNTSISLLRHRRSCRVFLERLLIERESAADAEARTVDYLLEVAEEAQRYAELIEQWPSTYLSQCSAPASEFNQQIAAELAVAAKHLIEEGELPPRGSISATARRYMNRYLAGLRELHAAPTLVLVWLALAATARAATKAVTSWLASFWPKLGGLMMVALVVAASSAGPRCSSEPAPAAQTLVPPEMSAPPALVVLDAPAMLGNSSPSPPGLPVMNETEALIYGMFPDTGGGLLHLRWSDDPFDRLVLMGGPGHIGLMNTNTSGRCAAYPRSACELFRHEDEVVLGCQCGEVNPFGWVGPQILFIGWVESEACGLLSGVAWLREPETPNAHVPLGAWGYVPDARAGCGLTRRSGFLLGTAEVRTWFDVDAQGVRDRVCGHVDFSWLACDRSWSPVVPVDLAEDELVDQGEPWWEVADLEPLVRINVPTRPN